MSREFFCSAMIFLYVTEHLELIHLLRNDKKMQLALCSVFQLGAATRLQGITPAAIVHLLNYVRHTDQRGRRLHRNKLDKKEEPEEELCPNNASLPQ